MEKKFLIMTAGAVKLVGNGNREDYRLDQDLRSEIVAILGSENFELKVKSSGSKTSVYVRFPQPRFLQNQLIGVVPSNWFYWGSLKETSVKEAEVKTIQERRLVLGTATQDGDDEGKTFSIFGSGFTTFDDGELESIRQAQSDAIELIRTYKESGKLVGENTLVLGTTCNRWIECSESVSSTGKSLHPYGECTKSKQVWINWNLDGIFFVHRPLNSAGFPMYWNELNKLKLDDSVTARKWTDSKGAERIELVYHLFPENCWKGICKHDGCPETVSLIKDILEGRDPEKVKGQYFDDDDRWKSQMPEYAGSVQEDTEKLKGDWKFVNWHSSLATPGKPTDLLLDNNLGLKRVSELTAEQAKLECKIPVVEQLLVKGYQQYFIVSPFMVNGKIKVKELTADQAVWITLPKRIKRIVELEKGKPFYWKGKLVNSNDGVELKWATVADLFPKKK